MEVDAGGGGGAGGVPYVYASFPVDVVVYFHMQPSTIRCDVMNYTVTEDCITDIITLKYTVL